ncbi:MAG: hypothetical protein RLZZ263_1224, partial [Cyanobacteriota bacterium]
RGDLVLSH